MEELRWRFHNNGYGEGKGLNDGGMETFKDHPDASLAREICQNSIDARKDKSLTAHVEFKTFKLRKEDLNGFGVLEDEIKKCYEFRKEHNPEGKQLKMMYDYAKKDEFICLRISDFNTTGLRGASTDDIDTPFNNLTKGSGICGKTGSSGGSKGIGKFAAFCASTINTVYYSTYTDKGEKGSIAVSRLRSAPVSPDNQKLLTTGIGYYAADDTNFPISEELYLDSHFKRKPDQTGTDLFVIGYNDKHGWKDTITAEILDGFMIAILNNNLTVTVEDIEINKDTIPQIIEYLSTIKIGTKIFRSIKSQYELFTGSEENSVYSTELVIGESKVKVYAKKYNKDEKNNASKQCIYVRYPYMKIKYDTGLSFLPYSAMVIIEDNDLNTRLREIENPQHTGWFISRLDDEPEEKEITKKLKKELENKVKEYVQSVLSQGTSKSTDVEGAGEFLPSFEEEGNVENMIIVSEDLTVTPVKKVSNIMPKTNSTGENGESDEFDMGSIGEGDEIFDKPGEENDIPYPNDDNPHEPSEGNEGNNEGDTPLLKRVNVSGIRFRNIAKDKDAGEYDIVFVASTDEKQCELFVNLIGESGDRYKIDIISASINDKVCQIKNNIIQNIELKKGVRYKVSYRTSNHNFFASEVVLNAYR